MSVNDWPAIAGGVDDAGHRAATISAMWSTTFLRPLQRGGVGQLHGDVEPALVLVGDVAGRQLRRGPPGQHQQAAVHHQHHDAAAQRQADHARVDVGGAAEAPVEQPEEPAQQQVEQPAEQVLFRAARLQQDGRQGRAERQRVERRDHRRDGDGQGELPEELPGDAADERARHEHRRQHQGHGDDRPGHLVHRLVGRLRAASCRPRCGARPPRRRRWRRPRRCRWPAPARTASGCSG